MKALRPNQLITPTGIVRLDDLLFTSVTPRGALLSQACILCRVVAAHAPPVGNVSKISTLVLSKLPIVAVISRRRAVSSALGACKCEKLHLYLRDM